MPVKTPPGLTVDDDDEGCHRSALMASLRAFAASESGILRARHDLYVGPNWNWGWPTERGAKAPAGHELYRLEIPVIPAGFRWRQGPLEGYFGLLISSPCSFLHASSWERSLKFMLEKKIKLKICCYILKRKWPNLAGKFIFLCNVLVT